MNGLAAAFPPEFARFGQTIGPPCPGATPLPELLGAMHVGPATRADRVAALSLWSQHYLLALVPCATAASLAARRDLPLALIGMTAVLAGDGHPLRLCLPHAGCDSVEACPVRRLAPLLQLHLVPLADALAAAGLLRPVFWSNAAAILVWSLRVIAAPEPDRAALRAALAAPGWADDAPNPFRDALVGDPARRRVCCLRFRLGIGRCPDCPVHCQTRKPPP